MYHWEKSVLQSLHNGLVQSSGFRFQRPITWQSSIVQLKTQLEKRDFSTEFYGTRFLRTYRFFKHFYSEVWQCLENFYLEILFQPAIKCTGIIKLSLIVSSQLFAAEKVTGWEWNIKKVLAVKERLLLQHQWYFMLFTIFSQASCAHFD